MDRQTLIDTIRAKQSFLCVGLDPDPARMPAHLGTGPEAVLAFNRALIEATSDLAVAYKPNVAFYESMGADGWAVLEETLAAIPEDCLGLPTPSGATSATRPPAMPGPHSRRGERMP